MITIEWTARIEHALVRTDFGDFLVFPDEHLEVKPEHGDPFEVSETWFGGNSDDYEAVLRAGLARLKASTTA